MSEGEISLVTLQSPAALTTCAARASSGSSMRRAAGLAAAAGVLLFLSFPTFSLTPLIFVAVVPLVVALADASISQAFALGWLTGVVGHLGAYSWVLPTIARFEHTSTVVALPFFVIFVAYQALQVALFAAGVVWVSRAGLHSPLKTQHPPLFFVPSWWVILEWGFPKLLPWMVAVPLAESPILRQAADLGGAYGLSFVVVLVNAAAASAILRHGEPWVRRLRPIGVAVAVVGVIALYGTVRVNHVGAHDSAVNGDLTILVVQGGVHSGRDDLAAANQEAWTTYTRLTTAGVLAAQPTSKGYEDKPDLIVWPETVLRVYLRQNDVYRNWIEAFVRRLERPLFVGSLDLPEHGPGELNSGYLIEPDSRETQVYHKQRLVPFGEYVPRGALVPRLSRWQTTGNFVAGDSAHARPVVLAHVPRATEMPAGPSIPSHESRTHHTAFAPSICFEAAWPGAFNRLVRDGAEFLISITDDGWFGDTAGPPQHLQVGILRAVETRRWLVRASNSGASAFIDPTGSMVAALPFGAVGVLQERIQTTQTLPPYVRYGDWPIALCVCVVAAEGSAKVLRWPRTGRGARTGA